MSSPTNKKYTRKIACGVFLATIAITTDSLANCLEGDKRPKFDCSSYDFGLPINVNNNVPTTTTPEIHFGISNNVVVSNSEVYSLPISGAINRVSTTTTQSGNIESFYASVADVYHTGSGTISFADAIKARIQNKASAAITEAAGIRISSPVNDGGGSIEKYYGLYIGVPTVATENYGIYSQGGINYFGGPIRATQICDQNGGNCKTITDGWETGGGGGGSGTVTSITAGTGLTGGTITDNGTIAVDVGFGPGKIVQLDENGNLPMVSGANLTDIVTTNLVGYSVSDNPNSGEILSFNGSSWTTKALDISDIPDLAVAIGGKLDAANMPASCGANQTLSFTSPTGMWSCTDIAFSTEVFGTQAQNVVMASPDGTSGAPTFRALTAADLPAGIGGWNELNGNLYRASGSIGIGTTTPSASLDINSSGASPSESQIALRNPNSSDYSLASIDAYSASEWRSSIWFMKDGSTPGTILGISTSNASGSSEERARITSEGNFGIGTNNPTSRLEVAGAIRADEICDRTGNNCKVISAGWSSGGGGSGTVTEIQTGIGLTGGPITTSGTLSVDVGTNPNQIIQLDSTGSLPAVNGANLTNVNATSINGTSVSITGNTEGQVLAYNGTNWANKTLTVSDINSLATNLGSKLDATNMPASCNVNQTLSFTSPTGMWSCTNIIFSPGAFGTQSQNVVLAAPNGSSGTPSFRALTIGDLPSGIGGWTELGGNLYRNTGNVGIGTTTPTHPLTVSGSAMIHGMKIQSSADGTNTSVGKEASLTAQNQWNTAFGYRALKLSTGVNNTALGSLAGSALEYGNGNLFVGNMSGKNLQEGSLNTIVGQDSASTLITGSRNTIIGSYVETPSTLNGYVIIADGEGTQRLVIDHNGNAGFGTTTPGARLDVAGTLRVDQICDRNGAHCKTLASGWNLPGPNSNETLAEIKQLKKENTELRKELKALADQVKILAQRSQPQGRKVASSK